MQRCSSRLPLPSTCSSASYRNAFLKIVRECRSRSARSVWAVFVDVVWLIVMVVPVGFAERGCDRRDAGTAIRYWVSVS